MSNIFKKTLDCGNGKIFTFETGHLAKQANASVIGKYGDTTILATVCFAKEDATDVDFFPMSVNYVEKAYAAGKIPGGFLKKEAKQSEREIIISRLIDRSIRPLFVDYFYRNVSVLCTLLSYDGEHEPDILAINTAMMAVKLSGLPIKSTIGAVRIGKITDKFYTNPTYKEIEESNLDLVISGTNQSITMVESVSSKINEDEIVEALELAQNKCKEIAHHIDDFAKLLNTSIIPYKPLNFKVCYDALQVYKDRLTVAASVIDKHDRHQNIDEIKKEAKNAVLAVHADVTDVQFKLAFGKLLEEIVRNNIINNKKRIDGRDFDEIRPIECEVDVLPIVHGSAIFTRGQTQVLSVVTIGGATDEKTLESVTDVKQKENFLLDYNFHSFSVGESTPSRAPSRREIGHGRLAYKALLEVLPTKQDFNHTIRVVAEVLESDGSTSQATICATSMALMAAGIPVSEQVAGIAMGLIKEDDKYEILTDIMADEDHLGDMDFKVAGTKDGITALQMDLKIDGVNKDLMKNALEKARVARLHILEKLNATIKESSKNTKLANNSSTMEIPSDKVRDVIGRGGVVIKKISEDFGVKIDIDKSGIATISSSKEDARLKAIEHITSIINQNQSRQNTEHSGRPARNERKHSTNFEVGKFYQAKVTGITTTAIYAICNDEKVKIPFEAVIGFNGDSSFIMSKLNTDSIIGIRCNEINEKGYPVFSTKLDYHRQDDSRKSSPVNKKKSPHPTKEKKSGILSLFKRKK